MDRINALTRRMEALAALQPAPDLVLILDDSSKQNVFGMLPEALEDLPIPEGRRVVSIEKDPNMDDLSAALYDWFEDIATGKTAPFDVGGAKHDRTN
mgnify:FL=1